MNSCPHIIHVGGDSKKQKMDGDKGAVDGKASSMNTVRIYSGTSTEQLNEM